MKKQAELLFRKKCKFEVSYRYELFYSLNVLIDPNSRIHTHWRKSTLKVLGFEFQSLLAELGGSWEIWPVLGSLLPGTLSNPEFDEIISGIDNLSISLFQEKVLQGQLHVEEVVKALMKKKSLKVALGKIPKTKREWISHIGLFPFDPESPQVKALENLVFNPENFRKTILRVLEIYWEKSFKATWEKLLPQMRRSLESRERLFHSCSLSEFSKQALLRIEVNHSKSEIQAIRGGYRLRYNDVENCYFLPSAFNDRRFWSAFKDNSKNTTVYFPYFDPSITLDFQMATETMSPIDPALDPALIFKALGDATRFAIVKVLARTPMSSVDLAKVMTVSKPTISHHIHLLREAGLIHEIFVGGAIQLHIKRSVIGALSDLTIAKLFETNEPLQLTRTRGGII